MVLVSELLRHPVILRRRIRPLPMTPFRAGPSRPLISRPVPAAAFGLIARYWPCAIIPAHPAAPSVAVRGSCRPRPLPMAQFPVGRVRRPYFQAGRRPPPPSGRSPVSRGDFVAQQADSDISASSKNRHNLTNAKNASGKQHYGTLQHAQLEGLISTHPISTSKDICRGIVSRRNSTSRK